MKKPELFQRVRLFDWTEKEIELAFVLFNRKIT